MRRNPVLQPLSPERHPKLVLANACARAAQSVDAASVKEACQRAIQALTSEHDAHFRTEEQSLLPLLHSPETQTLVQRTLMDYHQLLGLLTGFQQNEVETLNNFGKYLTAHVRFEERELFLSLRILFSEGKLIPDLKRQ